MKTRQELVEVMSEAYSALPECSVTTAMEQILTAIEAAGARVVPVEPTEEMWLDMWPRYHPHEGRTTPSQRPEMYERMKLLFGRYYTELLNASPFKGELG